jgi:RNA polymerase sigma-70 factor (ECF subfamily)
MTQPRVSTQEAELVSRAAGGDRDAFRTLHDSHAREVRRFLARRVGPDLADDLAAETFFRAWRGLSSYVDTGAPFRAWLYRIALRQVFSWVRQPSASELPIAWIDEVVSAGPEETVVERLTTQRALGAALDRLTHAQRRALEMRYLWDLDVAETAVMLGLAEPAARQLVHRALRAMLRHMEPIG